MEPIVIKSTPKTFQFGIIVGGDIFQGVTVKGTDLTYDPVTGLPITGAVRWMEYINYGSLIDAPEGMFGLPALTETDVATLNAGSIQWFEPASFLEFVAAQAQLTMNLTFSNGEFVGTSGDDRITLTDHIYVENRAVDGRLGDDILKGSETADTLSGSEGADRLFGNYGDDSLYGGTGDDQVFGGNDDDSILGGAGNDRIYGGDGHDWLFGDSETIQDYGVTDFGRDVIFGGSGDDIILGHSGNDRLLGDGGVDTIYGGMGADDIFGGDGNDYLWGDDNFVADDAADRLFGGDGDDVLAGGNGDDRLFGGNGNDTIILGEGDQIVNGGAGDDILGSEGNGTNVLIGGSGADQFLFVASSSTVATIRDFNAAEDVFSLYFAQTTTQQEQFDAFMAGATQVNQHVIWTSDTNTIVLKRLDIDDLTLDNFVDTQGEVVATY
ncbi:calcium-binding protein [Octadecabacter sp. 1_MG-2023]|uniref:calcium-binding protein n=1 Tax=unclassified Octadecabacter TaxID=196158 RepID=UPI001C08716E|nr:MULTISPECIES: calcium-binding protein [unclassified Octadecabacter]MBU2993261.1 hypothetical protein [Octadecabacter sp. B2R22]MDO6733284.1 calcium-binding protein [Octadecabacter sp. 1_MG-2023]